MHLPSFIDIDPLYVFSGFCVGALVGMTGVGGGSLMTPLLILLFGVHPATAVGTDLLFAASTKAAGTLVHGAARTIDWRLVGLLALGSVPAAIATLIFLSMLDLDGTASRHAVTLALGSVLLLTSVFLLCANSVRDRFSASVSKLKPGTVDLLTILLGALMGLLVSSTSVGAGAIGVTALLLLRPTMPIMRVVGSDIAHAVPLTLVAGFGHWLLGSVDWTLLGTLLFGSMPGVPSGKWLEFSVAHSPVTGRYRFRRQGQLADQWALWQAFANHRPCAC
jgi:uncharacterized protein